MNKSVYSVVERISMPWVYFLIAILIGISTAIMIRQVIMGKPVGTRPGSNTMVIIFWVFSAVIVPAFLLLNVLHVTVSDTRLHISAPLLFVDRTVLLADIEEVECVDCNPVLFAGGWGSRSSLSSRSGGSVRYYSLGGKHAVRIAMNDGSVIYLGLRDPDMLARYLQL